MKNAIKVNSTTEAILREMNTEFNLGLEFHGNGQVSCSESEGGWEYMKQAIAEAEAE